MTQIESHWKSDDNDDIKSLHQRKSTEHNECVVQTNSKQFSQMGDFQWLLLLICV